MSYRATRVRVAIAAPAIAAVAALSAMVAAPAATAAPVSGGVHSSPAALVRPDTNVYNFSLTTTQAKAVQVWLRPFGYSGALDGLLGPQSWMAFQRLLTSYGYPSNEIDGIPGSITIEALQRLLKEGHFGYNDPVDGIAGPDTEAAFKRLANLLIQAGY